MANPTARNEPLDHAVARRLRAFAKELEWQLGSAGAGGARVPAAAGVALVGPRGSRRALRPSHDPTGLNDVQTGLPERVPTVKSDDRSHAELCTQLGEPQAFEVESPSGRVFQLEVLTVWDDKRARNLRVMVAIDDSTGWRIRDYSATSSSWRPTDRSSVSEPILDATPWAASRSPASPAPLSGAPLSGAPLSGTT
jgi:hypothetical protein